MSKEKTKIKRNKSIIITLTIVAIGLLGSIILLRPNIDAKNDSFRLTEASKPAAADKLTEISILQWNHFVPQYDKWFDPFALDWGKTVGANVVVEHISLTELSGRLNEAIDAGEGPTLVELIIGASSFTENVHDLTDLNRKAQDMFGEQIETCHANSYLPTTERYYGFCVGWVPDPGNYNIELWTEAGFPEGPKTWMELLEGGQQIKDEFGVPVGIGLSPELDSEMANRAIIWSFGGSIQDANENVVINSPEVLSAVEFMTELYQNTMTDDVFEWNAATNNQGLIAGELSYILNSVSAYRSLQKLDPESSDNIGFVEPLRGPDGRRYASSHVWSVYVIPNYVQGEELEAAQDFLLHLASNYNQAVFNAELYNFPAFINTVPELYEEGGWLDIDPFGSRPSDKLKILANAEEWVTHLGYPGPANPAVAEVYATNIISTMMGEVARGEKSPEQAIADAEIQINAIFDKWREKGLVGGVSN